MADARSRCSKKGKASLSSSPSSDLADLADAASAYAPPKTKSLPEQAAPQHPCLLMFSEGSLDHSPVSVS